MRPDLVSSKLKLILGLDDSSFLAMSLLATSLIPLIVNVVNNYLAELGDASANTWTIKSVSYVKVKVFF